MPISLQSIAAASIAVTLLMSTSHEASAQASCVAPKAELAAVNEVDRALAAFGSRLVAVGRVDRVSAVDGIDVLGYRVQPTAGEHFQVGDYAAVVDWSPRGARERALEARAALSRYVPGASEVFVKSAILRTSVLLGRTQLNNVDVDFSTSSFATKGLPAGSGAMLIVRGTQPSPNGVVLSRCISVDGSLGTGRIDGSLGTGRVDGSLGTGRADGSLGTGKLDGSLGTGRAEGSLGTGRAEGSLGTGRADGSLGTGRVDGSLGTGKVDGSLGTGSPAAD